MENQFSAFTTDQLKVMVYDLSISFARIKADLDVINQEIARREQEKNNVVEKKEEST
jgi:hypothetical protein